MLCWFFPCIHYVGEGLSNMDSIKGQIQWSQNTHTHIYTWVLFLIYVYNIVLRCSHYTVIFIANIMPNKSFLSHWSIYERCKSGLGYTPIISAFQVSPDHKWDLGLRYIMKPSKEKKFRERKKRRKETPDIEMSSQHLGIGGRMTECLRSPWLLSMFKTSWAIWNMVSKKNGR